MLLLLALACGLDTPEEDACTTPCEKLFGDESGQCNIQIPGKPGAEGREEMIGDCLDHCLDAMEEEGEMGDYDPNERASGEDEVALENRTQAEAWMECVEETSCDLLDQNYCAPVKYFP